MKISKHTLRQLIRETIEDMSSEIEEASALKKFKVRYKTKSGKDGAITVKARDKDEAMSVARGKLMGRMYDLYYAKQVDEGNLPTFDPKKMAALAKKDMFIAQALKKYKPEVVFNTYVLDDSEMQRQYMMEAQGGGDWGVRWTEFNNKNQLIGKEKFFPTRTARDKFVEKLYDQDNFNQVTATSDLKEETTTGDVMGYDAPLSFKDDNED